MTKRRIYLIALAILFFIIIIFEYHYFELFTDSAFSSIYTADGREYLDATDTLFNQSKAHPTRTIGFPLFLKVIYLVGKGEFDYRIFFVSQLLIWFFTDLLIFFLVDKFRSGLTAFMAALLFLLLPGTGIRCLQIMTEPLYFFLLTSFAFLLIVGVLERKNNMIIGGWIILVFSILVRPTLFYGFVIILPWFLYYFFEQRKFFNLIVCLLFPIVFIGTQVRLIHNLTGEYKLSYIADITTYYYFSAYISATENSDNKMQRDVKWRELKMERKEKLQLHSSYFSRAVLEKNDWKESSAEIRNEVKIQVTKKTLIALKVYFRNFLQNSLGGNDNLVWINSNGAVFTRILFWLSRIQNLLITFLFLSVFCSHTIAYKMYRTKLWQAKSIIILIILNLILTDPISFAQGDRFRIVIFPLVLILFFIRKKRSNVLKKESDQDSEF